MKILDRLLNLLLVLLTILWIFWMLSVVGEVFRKHLFEFILFWIFLAIFGFWLNSEFLQDMFSKQILAGIRVFLMFAVVSISVLCFAHFSAIRDAFGHRYVEGFSVYYEEDSDNYGRPMFVGNVSTSHWYSRMGMWAFEWCFLLTCIALPWITWRKTSQAIEKAAKRSDF